MSAPISLDALLQEELATEKASRVKHLCEDDLIVLPEADKNDPFYKGIVEKPDFYLEEIDSLEDEECNDPDFRDWCRPARLKLDFADPDMGVKHLREHDLQGQAESADDEIESAIYAAIYRTESQERNRHDRLMVDVPKNGRRKGGTHGLPRELRRTRSAKVVNEQLLRWNAPVEECREAEQFYHAANARIARNSAFVLYKYTGPHADVLNLRLQGKSTKEIADALGKTTRRIRQIINGNAQRNEKGLHQIIDELMQAGVPADFQCNAPVLVQRVHTRRKSLQKDAVLGQLAWDMNALSVGVAA
ncbi:MAG: hypothetical protein ACYC2J_11215 [Acidithiobacillus ferrooxidans]|uniref:Uncharacterized protein n=1 Tax=mine drainage metagenome TaxID=410659 RepID=E6Q9V9_9ZZZZ